MAHGHKSGLKKVVNDIREEAARQIRGFPREAKYQLRGFGKEAIYQLSSGWGEEFARQIFGNPRSRRR